MIDPDAIKGLFLWFRHGDAREIRLLTLNLGPNLARRPSCYRTLRLSGNRRTLGVSAAIAAALCSRGARPTVSRHAAYVSRETALPHRGAASRLLHSISESVCGASPAATNCRRYTAKHTTKRDGLQAHPGVHQARRPPSSFVAKGIKRHVFGIFIRAAGQFYFGAFYSQRQIGKVALGKSGPL